MPGAGADGFWGGARTFLKTPTRRVCRGSLAVAHAPLRALVVQSRGRLVLKGEAAHSRTPGGAPCDEGGEELVFGDDVVGARLRPRCPCRAPPCRLRKQQRKGH